MRARSPYWLATALAIWLPWGTANAQPANPAAGTIEVYDGFEGLSLSEVWDTSRFAAGAVRLQTNLVRVGQRAAEVTVRSGEKYEAGIGGSADSERAELLEARAFVSRERATYEYAFSLFFPEAFPIVPTRLVVAQWKQYCPEGRLCSDDSPVPALRYMSGVLRITQDIGKKHNVLYREKGEFRGRWLDFKLQIRCSPGADGRVRAWLDDKNLVNFTGATANAEDDTTGYQKPGYFYFKMGLYRNLMAEPMTVYIDEYRKREVTLVH